MRNKWSHWKAVPESVWFFMEHWIFVRPTTTKIKYFLADVFFFFLSIVALPFIFLFGIGMAIYLNITNQAEKMGDF